MQDLAKRADYEWLQVLGSHTNQSSGWCQPVVICL